MPQEFTLNPKFASLKSLKVGVILGGVSSERTISIRSGKAVIQALKRLGIQTVMIDPKYKSRMNQRLKAIDVAFIALHGKGGEDGEIQKTLDRKKIPYAGSAPVPHLNSFDKLKSKRIFSRGHVPSPQYWLLRRSDWRKKLPAVKWPVFIKPLQEGSSVGVFEIANLESAKSKLKKAFKHYPELLAEKAVEGREFTVGILDDKPLPAIELIPSRDFFDYKAKYTPGMTRYEIPVSLSGSEETRLKRIALKAHKALKLRDFSRVDLMRDGTGRFYVLEVNSIPGLTEMSLLPKAARAAGISFEELCSRVLINALKREGKK